MPKPNASLLSKLPPELSHTVIASVSDRSPPDGLVVFIAEGKKPTVLTSDATLSKAAAAALARIGISGKFRELRSGFGVEGISSPHFIVAGLGKTDELTELKLRNIAGLCIRELRRLKCKRACFALPDDGVKLAIDRVAHAIRLAAGLANFQFLDFKSSAVREREIEKFPTLSELALYSPVLSKSAARSKVESAAAEAEIIARGCNTTRFLVATPGNALTATTLAESAEALARSSSLRVTVWDKARIEREGFGGLLAVNQGSEEPPRFIILEHWGTAKSKAPIVVIGKGVTFDTGGISIKPSENMQDMIYDMAGAGAALGIMKIVSDLKLPVNVVGLIPTTDNMPSGKAYKPGDIITMHSGKTVEIISTDAEGRMILADALSYSARYKPKAIIDIATLTGACHVMLGDEAYGAFSNDSKLSEALMLASALTGENAYPLPAFEGYRSLIDSFGADIKNSGGRFAGASTAALFLKEFVPADTPWVHLDIAGIAWTQKDRDLIAKGPSGVPVRTIVELIRGMMSN